MLDNSRQGASPVGNLAALAEANMATRATKNLAISKLKAK
jgi:hypothetical protein